MSHVDLNRLFPIEPPALRGGRWLLGLGILAVLLTCFWLGGVFDQTHGQIPRVSWGPALFFSVLIAYIAPMFGYISERTVAAIQALAPVLDAAPDQIAAWQRRVAVKPVGWLVVVLAIGIGSGIAHNLLLYGSAANLFELVSRSRVLVAVSAGTLLVWVTVTLVIAGLLDNALLLNRLARRVRVQPFDTRALRPFATVAVISTLALIGAQAAFPIMTVEGGVDPMAYIPGLIATALPMLLLAGLPVWPVHRRLVDLKREILRDVNRRIGALPLPDPACPETLSALTPLLNYRREVAQISEWPFDVGVMARLGLYLIIPPLTWVGAALIENLVDALL